MSSIVFASVSFMFFTMVSIYMDRSMAFAPELFATIVTIVPLRLTMLQVNMTDQDRDCTEGLSTGFAECFAV